MEKTWRQFINVDRKDGELVIRIKEENIKLAAESYNWQVKDQDKFINALVNYIQLEETNAGYDDTLLILRFIDNATEHLGCYDPDCGLEIK